MLPGSPTWNGTSPAATIRSAACGARSGRRCPAAGSWGYHDGGEPPSSIVLNLLLASVGQLPGRDSDFPGHAGPGRVLRRSCCCGPPQHGPRTDGGAAATAAWRQAAGSRARPIRAGDWSGSLLLVAALFMVVVFVWMLPGTVCGGSRHPGPRRRMLSRSGQPPAPEPPMTFASHKTIHSYRPASAGPVGPTCLRTTIPHHRHVSQAAHTRSQRTSCAGSWYQPLPAPELQVLPHAAVCWHHRRHGCNVWRRTGWFSS